MSLQALSDAIEPLPYALSEQVLSYARSLELAAPEILADAGVERTKERIDALVFIAGLRKLFSIVDSNYWVVDNAGAILSKQQDQYEVRVGGSDLSRGGTYHESLRQMLADFQEVLAQHDLLRYVRDVSYSDVVREMVDER